MTRVSQSALEYMMTYGWAILIIVIVAGVLYSLGIFSPSSSASATITGFSGLGSPSALCMSNGGLRLQFGNNIGKMINITSINLTVNDVTEVIYPGETISPQANQIFYIPNVCGASPGARYSFTSTVAYTEPGETFKGPYLSSGTVSGIVSSSIIPYWVVEHTNGSVSNFGSPAIPINASTTSFTILLFAKIETDSPSNDFAFSIPRGCSQGVWYHGPISIGWTTTNKQGASGCTSTISVPGLGYNYNQPFSWTFYTIEYESTTKTFSVYIDTKLVDSVSLNSTSWLENQFLGGVMLFQREGTSYSLSEVSDVQVYNDSLTTSQISEIYENSTFQPLFGKNLILWMPMNGTAKDYSGHNLNINAYSVVFTTQHS